MYIHVTGQVNPIYANSLTQDQVHPIESTDPI